MIGIRTDGNDKIGTGHIMRCASIVQQIQSMGETPVFLLSEENGAVREMGYRYAVTGSPYNDLSQENIMELLQELSIETVLVDTYYADDTYMRKLQKIKTAVIFDWGDDTVHCDLLIDYNINYNDFKFSNAKKTLLGPKYAPLREEFTEHCGDRSNDEVCQVLLTTGGTDAHNATGKIIRAIQNSDIPKDLRFHVVVGALNCWADEICAIGKEDARFVCHRDVKNMSEFMRQSNMALSAGGSTLYELCACGLPCVAFSIADNQDKMIETMAERGVMLFGGVLRLDEEKALANIVFQLKRLIADRDLRSRLSRQAQVLVDGKGAQRIAWELIRLNSGSYARV